MQWLLKNHRDLIDAEFALNEGGGVGLMNGKPLANSVQTSEKVSLSYQLEVKNPGGHSSLPSKDNAIYRLADGLARLARFDFPVQLNETTRAYFQRTAALDGRPGRRRHARRWSPRSPIRRPSPGCRTRSATTRCCARPASPRCLRAGTPSTRCRKPREPA